MIYSTEDSPRAVVTQATVQFHRLYTVHDNANNQEYVAFRVKVDGVVGHEKVMLWAPADDKSWYFDSTATPAIEPDIVIYDDILDEFKYVMEQGQQVSI